MNIFRLALELFAIYMLYKLVFDFILPIYRTTKDMKGKMQDMSRRMSEQQQAQNEPVRRPEADPAVKKNFAGDYIDYEEVK